MDLVLVEAKPIGYSDNISGVTDVLFKRRVKDLCNCSAREE